MTATVGHQCLQVAMQWYENISKLSFLDENTIGPTYVGHAPAQQTWKI